MMRMMAKMLTMMLLSFSGRYARAMNTEIAPDEVECFYLEALKYEEGLSLNYQVLRGNGDEMVTILHSPSKIKLFSKVGPAGRFITPVPEDGLYELCFTHKSGQKVLIGFSFHADDPTHEVLSHADTSKIGNFRSSLSAYI
jgi:hypothetical protein